MPSSRYYANGWPEGAKQGDVIEIESGRSLDLPGHHGYFEHVADVFTRSEYGDSYNVNRYIRQELWCSCGVRLMHNALAGDASKRDYQVAMMWHVMMMGDSDYD